MTEEDKLDKLDKHLTAIEDIVVRLKESDLSKFTSDDKEVIIQLLNDVEWMGDVLKENEPK